MAKEDTEFPLGLPPRSPETPFNPFYNNSVHFDTPSQVIKTVLMMPIFLVRVILLTLLFFIGFLWTKLVMIGAKNNSNKPFPKWRRNLIWPVALFARGVLFTCGYHYIHIKGKPAPRHVAPIIVCNHVSFVDPVFVFLSHLPIIVTAKHNLQIPVAGIVMRAIQAIAVDRASPTSRRDASGEIRRRAQCNDWGHIALFPEATTTNGRSLVSFKTGAFMPGLPVQPIVVRYPFASLDPSWVADGLETHMLLFRMMTQLQNKMHVEYLDVQYPTALEQQQPHLFAERVRMVMAKALNVPVSDHSFGDVALALEAQKLKMGPPGAAVVEFGKLERAFKLDTREAKGYLRTFKGMGAAGTSGLMSYEDFLLGVDLPDSLVLQKSFDLFDGHSRGVVTFREFVTTLAHVSKHHLFSACVRNAFSAFDLDGDDQLNEQDVADTLGVMLPSVSKEQVQKLFDTLDVEKKKAVNWNNFSDFLHAHPEYLVVFLFARPSLAPSHDSEKSGVTSS